MLVVVAVAATLLYAPVLTGMARQWWVEPNSSHGLLLIAVAALLLYRRSDRLRALPLQPRNAGLAIVFGGLAVFAAGTITGDIFILRASLPVVLAGAVLAVGGVAHLRMLAAPLALLVIAIPLPAVIVTHLTMPLQLVASQVAASVLQTFQVPVVREGNLLMLERATLEVADVCSGLRSLVSLVSVTAVCAAFFSMSARRVLLLFAAAVPIAIVGNGLRVAATGLLTTVMGRAAAEGFIHDATGFVAFVAMCALVIALQIVTRPRRQSAPAAAAAA
jgi:exosortase